MMKKIIIILLIFINTSTYILAQSDSFQNTSSVITKAEYPTEDLSEFLKANIKYPRDAYRKDIEGDVIFSFVILKTGELDSLLKVSSPDISLSLSAIKAFEIIKDNWKPATINKNPINQKYKIVFSYRIYKESVPPNYIKKAEKYFNKKKYKKALKKYNKAIKVHPYNSKLYAYRSKTKQILGDIKGANEDKNKSQKLKSEIMTTVDLTILKKTRTKTTVIRTSKVVY